LKTDGGFAFPGGEHYLTHDMAGNRTTHEKPPCNPGMTLRDYFKAAALQNNALCSGQADWWELKEWFGDRGGITRQEIVAKQAASYADAMIEQRSKDA